MSDQNLMEGKLFDLNLRIEKDEKTATGSKKNSFRPVSTGKMNRDDIALSPKHKQLNAFPDMYFNSGLVDTSQAKLEELPYVLVPKMLTRYPFFMLSNTKKVRESRKGHIKYLEMIAGKKKGIPDTELREKTKYEVSPMDYIANYSETENAVSGTEQNLVAVVCKNNWNIVAHPNWGLPDEFDFFVWDFLLQVASSHDYQHHNIPYLYLLTETQFVNFFISQGIYKEKGGILYERIRSSLMRLANTKYYHSQGTYSIDLKKVLSKSEYQIQLITSLFFKGDTLPDGQVCNSVAIAIDPLLIQSLRGNDFLKAFHPKRQLLKQFPTKCLFDKINFMVYTFIKHGDYNIAKKNNIKPFIFLRYSTICDFLGYEPRSQAELKPSKIFQQFFPVFDELIANNVINNVLIDYFINDNDHQAFNLVFHINTEFIENVISTLSKEGQQNAIEQRSMKESDDYFKKIMNLFRNDCQKEFFVNENLENFYKQEVVKLDDDEFKFTFSKPELLSEPNVREYPQKNLNKEKGVLYAFIKIVGGQIMKIESVRKKK